MSLFGVRDLDSARGLQYRVFSMRKHRKGDFWRISPMLRSRSHKESHYFGGTVALTVAVPLMGSDSGSDGYKIPI
jgi:hypothetical protein